MTRLEKITKLTSILKRILKTSHRDRESKSYKEVAQLILVLFQRTSEHSEAVRGDIEKVLEKKFPADSFEYSPKIMAEAILDIMEILALGSSGGGEPPKDPPQYLFDLLKQETEQLWQRSIMLLTIFSGIFIAYGQIIMPIFTITQEAHKSSQQSHFFAALIALVGVVFSLIWIAVGKGANYWYNKYYVVLENEYNQKHDPSKMSYFNLPPIAVNDCLLSTYPGRYSISRSQVAIGIIILCIWFVIFATHTVQFVINAGWGWINKLIDWLPRWITLGVIVLAFGIVCGIVYITLSSLKHEGKSDYSMKTEREIKKITNNKENDAKKAICEVKGLLKGDSAIKESLDDRELTLLAEYLYNRYYKK